MVFGMIRTRLTGPKEGGAFQTVAGRRVALGVPGGFDDAAASALAPLARVGEPEEAAGAMLALARWVFGALRPANGAPSRETDAEVPPSQPAGELHQRPSHRGDGRRVHLNSVLQSLSAGFTITQSPRAPSPPHPPIARLLLLGARQRPPAPRAALGANHLLHRLPEHRPARRGDRGGGGVVSVKSCTGSPSGVACGTGDATHRRASQSFWLGR